MTDTLYEVVLLPTDTFIDRGFPFGPEVEWFMVSAPGFMLEGWAGMPEDDVRSFVSNHADPEDVEQVLAALRFQGLTS